MGEVRRGRSSLSEAAEVVRGWVSRSTFRRGCAASSPRHVVQSGKLCDGWRLEITAPVGRATMETVSVGDRAMEVRA